MDLKIFNLNLAGTKRENNLLLNMVLGLLGIGGQEMLLIVFVILLLFGGKKLPELARGLGRGIREFKDASESIKRDISEQINNFEKDIDVKSVMVEDVESAVGSARKSLEQHHGTSGADAATESGATTGDPATTEESTAIEQAKAKPVFPAGAPAGTYQHNPGREPDYVGSKDVYYNHSGAGQSAEPPSETTSPDHTTDPQTKPQQSTDHS